MRLVLSLALPRPAVPRSWGQPRRVFERFLCGVGVLLGLLTTVLIGVLLAGRRQELLPQHTPPEDPGNQRRWPSASSPDPPLTPLYWGLRLTIVVVLCAEMEKLQGEIDQKQREGNEFAHLQRR